jgi:hypothetical protein
MRDSESDSELEAAPRLRLVGAFPPRKNTQQWPLLKIISRDFSEEKIREIPRDLGFLGSRPATQTAAGTRRRAGKTMTPVPGGPGPCGRPPGR